MKRHEYKKMDMPRLDPEVKAMNGKSTTRLKQCIDTLCDVLDKTGAPRETAEDRSVSEDQDSEVV